MPKILVTETKLQKRQGVILAIARTAAKLSQDELAARLNLTRQAISSMECGRTAIPNHLIPLLAQVLNQSPELFWE